MNQAQQNVALFLKNLRANPLNAPKPPQSAVNAVAEWFKERCFTQQAEKIIIKINLARKKKPKTIIITRKKKKKTSTRLKKMTAGMSVLMTSGLMDRVRGFRTGTSTTQITPKMLKNYFKKKQNKEDLKTIVCEEVIYPAEEMWCDADYYGELKVKARGAIYGLATFGKLYSMRGSHYTQVEDEFDIEDYQAYRATQGSINKCMVAVRKELIELAKNGSGRLEWKRSYGEGVDTGIKEAIQDYVEQNTELYEEGLVSKAVWTHG